MQKEKIIKYITDILKTQLLYLSAILYISVIIILSNTLTINIIATGSVDLNLHSQHINLCYFTIVSEEKNLYNYINNISLHINNSNHFLLKISKSNESNRTSILIETTSNTADICFSNLTKNIMVNIEKIEPINITLEHTYTTKTPYDKVIAKIIVIGHDEYGKTIELITQLYIFPKKIIQLIPISSVIYSIVIVLSYLISNKLKNIYHTENIDNFNRKLMEILLTINTILYIIYTILYLYTLISMLIKDSLSLIFIDYIVIISFIPVIVLFVFEVLIIFTLNLIDKRYIVIIFLFLIVLIALYSIIIPLLDAYSNIITLLLNNSDAFYSLFLYSFSILKSKTWIITISVLLFSILSTIPLKQTDKFIDKDTIYIIYIFTTFIIYSSYIIIDPFFSSIFSIIQKFTLILVFLTTILIILKIKSNIKLYYTNTLILVVLTFATSFINHTSIINEILFLFSMYMILILPIHMIEFTKYLYNNCKDTTLGDDT